MVIFLNLDVLLQSVFYSFQPMNPSHCTASQVSSEVNPHLHLLARYSDFLLIRSKYLICWDCTSRKYSLSPNRSLKDRQNNSCLQTLQTNKLTSLKYHCSLHSLPFDTVVWIPAQLVKNFASLNFLCCVFFSELHLIRLYQESVTFYFIFILNFMLRIWWDIDLYSEFLQYDLSWIWFTKASDVIVPICTLCFIWMTFSLKY